MASRLWRCGLRRKRRCSWSTTATASFADGTERDVSAEASWSLEDARLGTFSGPTLTASGAGGRTRVRATWRSVQAERPVTVRIRLTDRAPGVPADAAERFAVAEADPRLAPTVVYPKAGTWVIPNAGGFEVHWTRAAGTDLFEVGVEGELAELHAYVSAAQPTDAWFSFSRAHWDALAAAEAGHEVRVTVRGTSTAAPAAAGASGEVVVRVATNGIVGGLYYWTSGAAGAPAGIDRYDYAAKAATPESAYTDAGRCLGCHALSRDGTAMAVTYDGLGGPSTVVDVRSRSPRFPASTQSWTFASFAPEGDRILVVSDGVLTVRDSMTGNVLATVPEQSPASHPEWSPKGDAIAYVVRDPGTTDIAFNAAAIVTRSYDAATFAFGPAVPGVAGSGLFLQPSWSPDGEWLLFTRSADDSYDSASAEVWVMKVDGSAAPIRLDAANLSANLSNAWPRWAPAGVGTHASGEPALWFTFGSRRPVGVRSASGGRQLWIAPFFRERALAGQDPSGPALRLPFQTHEADNYFAQWTDAVVAFE